MLQTDNSPYGSGQAWGRRNRGTLIDSQSAGLGMWRAIRQLIGILVFVGILLSSLEVGLRAFPGELIPLGWLKRFRSDVRVEIA